MKKLVVLFVFMPFILLSQVSENVDMVNRKIFEFVKSQDSDNLKIRELLIEKTKSIIAKTTDEELKKQCQEYINSFKSESRLITYNVDLSKATKKELKSFRVIKDKFDSTTNIYVKNSRYNKFRLNSTILGGTLYLFLETRYQSDTWIFMDYIEVLVGDKKYSYQLKDPNREVTDTGIKEWAVNSANSYLLEMLKDISNTDGEVLMRFVGSTKHEVLTVTRREKNDLVSMFRLIDIIKEK